MTNVKLASVGLATLFLSAIAMNVAEARTRHVTEIRVKQFDRHALDGASSIQAHALPAAQRSRSPTASRRVAKHQRARSAPITKGDHVIVARTGARASVSIVARPHFVCLIEKLESAGYQIDFMGGYASRGNSSAHPTGNALDINQTGRNLVTRRFPAGVSQMASACGLVHGGGWLSSPDQGHFEMPRKYGYLYRQHRTRLARVH